MEVPGNDFLPRSNRRRVGPDPAGPSKPRMSRAEYQPIHPRIGRAHRYVEDPRTQAGTGQIRVQSGVLWRPSRRGAVARQRADLLGSVAAAPVGSPAPTPGTVETVQRAHSSRRVNSGISAI